jgi:hypothetical protein
LPGKYVHWCHNPAKDWNIDTNQKTGGHWFQRFSWKSEISVEIRFEFEFQNLGIFFSKIEQNHDKLADISDIPNEIDEWANDVTLLPATTGDRLVLCCCTAGRRRPTSRMSDLLWTALGHWAGACLGVGRRRWCRRLGCGSVGACLGAELLQPSGRRCPAFETRFDQKTQEGIRHRKG